LRQIVWEGNDRRSGTPALTSRTAVAMVTVFCSAIALSSVIVCQTPEGTTKANLHAAQRLPWYITAVAMHRMMLKSPSKFYLHEQLSLDLEKAREQLRTLKAEGIDSLDVYAPEEGATSYGGLDAKDRYRLDPGIGTMDDLRRVIREAHAMHMEVISSQNLGYSALDAPQFLRAEDDIRAGRTSRETRFFFWSKRADTPPPAAADSYFLIQPSPSGQKEHRTQFWQWSDRAQAYFWTRWPGKNADDETTHLPQYDWGGSAWPEEASKVVDFWMSTGLDGMVVDAVNWYLGYNWKTNAALVATYRKHPGAKMILPEGGGAFHTDDPIGWILDGGWTALYDYGIDIPWEKNNRPILESINTGNPAIYEKSLRDFHDRVVAAGGILVAYVVDLKDARKQQLAEELVATSGDLVCYCGPDPVTNHPAPGVAAILKLKAHHPAFYQNSLRRRVATNQDQSVYATVRYAADGSEQLLAAFNFSQETKDVLVDARAIDGGRYEDLESERVETPQGGSIKLTLPGYGHHILRIER
jgi:hypothetical protein